MIVDVISGIGSPYRRFSTIQEVSFARKRASRDLSMPSAVPDTKYLPAVRGESTNFPVAPSASSTEAAVLHTGHGVLVTISLVHPRTMVVEAFAVCPALKQGSSIELIGPFVHQHDRHILPQLRGQWCGACGAAHVRGSRHDLRAEKSVGVDASFGVGWRRPGGIPPCPGEPRFLGGSLAAPEA